MHLLDETLQVKQTLRHGARIVRLTICVFVYERIKKYLSKAQFQLGRLMNWLILVDIYTHMCTHTYVYIYILIYMIYQI